MIPHASTLEEALEFFLTHSSGNIMCEKENGEQKECNCYPDAKAFFEA